MECVSRIGLDPEIRVGTLRMRGTRIIVGDVLSYPATRMSEADILADFPQLKREGIRERELRIFNILGVWTGAPSRVSDWMRESWSVRESLQPRQFSS